MRKDRSLRVICWIGMLGLLMGAIPAGVVFAANEMPGHGVVVQPARATWTTGFFLEALYSRALKDLGYDVKKPKELANPIFYQSVANGDVDFWANGWFPLHNNQLPKNFFDKAVLAGTVAAGGALQGYLADKASVEKFGIQSLDDFKRPEVKKAFDANGDGKADLVACPPGWGCEKAIAFHLKAYNLEGDINPIKAAYAASMADALARYKAGSPILFYTWTPNWTVFKLKPGKDVVWINVPEIKPMDSQKGFEEAMVRKDVPGAVTNPLKMGFPANDIKVVANKKFLAENPAANNFFEGADSRKDIEAQVEAWIAKNKEAYDGWLQAAREAAK